MIWFKIKKWKRTNWKRKSIINKGKKKFIVKIRIIDKVVMIFIGGKSVQDKEKNRQTQK